MEARMASQPSLDAWMCVGAVVVHDEMQRKMGRCLSINFREAPDELLVAMSWQAIADDFPIEQAQRREQGSVKGVEALPYRTGTPSSPARWPLSK